MITTSLAPVRELHGRSVKAQLAQCLVPVHRAATNDLIAVCETGLFAEGAPFVNARTFLRKTATGYAQCRLSDLPSGLRPVASAALGYIDNDWELTGDLADAAPAAFDEDHPDQWFETIKFFEGIGFLRLQEPGGTTTTSVLFMKTGKNGVVAASSPAETAALMEVFSDIATRQGQPEAGPW